MLVKRLNVCLMLVLFIMPISLPVMAGASFLELLGRSDKYTEVKDFAEALAAGADPNERDAWDRTPLNKAISNHRADLIIFLIDNGADPNLKDKQGKTALDHVMTDPDLKTVDLLIEKGARSLLINPDLDPDSKDEKGTPLLIQAILAQNQIAVRYLLRAGADPNCRDAEESTPLIRAFYNLPQVASMLMKAGADVKLADNWQRTPLHVAAKLDKNSLPALLEAGALIETVASGAYTPLMYACSGEFPENVAFLLDRGAKIDVRDDYGRTPLHLACISRQINAVFFVVEAGAAVDARDNSGYTPLLTLYKERFKSESAGEIKDYLLANGADINAVASNGDTIMSLAERYDDPIMLTELVENGARLQLPDGSAGNEAKGRAALLLQCVKDDRRAMAGFLLRAMTSNEIPARTDKGETALHLAVARNNERLVKTLLKAGFDANATTTDGATPLHIALRGFGSDLVIPLLQAGARPDIVDKKGETALQLADKRGDNDLFELLINFSRRDPAEAEAMRTAAASETSLLAAIRSNQRLTIERLLSGTPDTKERDAEGNTALHLSISRHSRQWATALLKAGADPVAANDEGLTPLHIAAKAGNIRLTRLLLDRAVPVDITDRNGRTALFMAVKQRHFALSELLLKRGANVNHFDKRGITPLFESVGADPLLVTFSWLIKKGAAINTVSHDGRTVFHELIRWEPSKWRVEKLVSLGADLFKQDRWNESPFSMGLRFGQSEIIEFLLEQQPDFTQIAASGTSILHSWTSSGRIDLLSRALAHGVDPNLANSKEEPLLFAAIMAGSASASELLIKSGADIEYKTASGATLLEKVINAGYSEPLRFLLKTGANPNATCSNGLPPLLQATGRWQLFNILLEHGATADLTVLHDKKHKNLFKALVEKPEGVAALRRIADKGVDLRPLFFPGETPGEKYESVFGWAWIGCIDTVKLAIELGFNLKETDQQGYTLLHWAARGDRTELVRYLLKQGADLEALSYKAETPLCFALDGSAHDTVLALLNAGADTTLKQGITADTMLHMAAENNARPEVIARLIKSGLTIDCLDAYGGTPLLRGAERNANLAVASLLELGANPNIASEIASFSLTDPAFVKARHSLYSRGSYMHIWKMNGITPLARAVVQKNAAIASMLLKHGARIDIVDSLGNTPLHIAALISAPEMAEIMLAHEPPVLLRNHAGENAIELADSNGLTDIAFAMWKKIPAHIKQDPDQQTTASEQPFPLHEAVLNNELTRLRWLVRGGRRVDELDDEKRTPLWLAVERQRDNAVKVLLQLDASPDYAPRGKEPPWFLAAKNGKVEMIAAIASSGFDINTADKQGNTALHLAAANHRDELILHLLGLNADLGIGNKLGRTPLMESITRGEDRLAAAKTREYVEKVNARMREIKSRLRKKKRWPPLKKVPQFDIRSQRCKSIQALALKHPSISNADIYGQTALHLAARNSDAEVIILLTDIGCELEARDRKGRTPLYHAITTDNLEAVSELIRLGAVIDMADYSGETPLSLCDALNRGEIENFLRESGAAPELIVPKWPNESPTGQNALIRAATENRQRAVCYLLDRGAGINDSDKTGETALFQAVRTGSPGMVELLLQRGAGPLILNNAGQKPLDVAKALIPRFPPRHIGTEGIPQDEIEMLKNRQRIVELLEQAQTEATPSPTNSGD